VALPELEPAGDDAGDEDDGVLDAEPLLLQLDPGRVRERARDGLRDVLRERRRHRVVEEEQEPPGGAHAPDQPAAAVHARPLALGPPGRLLGRRRGGGGRPFPLVVVVVVGPVAIRGRRRRLLPPPQERHGARRGGGGSEGYLRGPTRIPDRPCGGARSKTLGGGGSGAGGSRGLVAWRLRGVRACEVAREEERRQERLGRAALGTAAPQVHSDRSRAPGGV
jgi:hypothetical protein